MYGGKCCRTADSFQPRTSPSHGSRLRNVPELGRAVGIGTDELVAGVRVTALFDVPCVVHNAPYAVAFVREFGLVARVGNEELDLEISLNL